jgi:hypothetical protein
VADARELAAIFRVKAEGEQELDRMEKRFAGLEEHLGPGAARAATVGAAGVALVTTALGVAADRALALGTAFDDSFDRIRIGTGKTDEELENLQSSFRTVAADGPSSFQDVSKAITEVNQRLDLTGANLEARSAQFLNLARLTGGDLSENIRSGAKAFQEWNVAAEQQGETLDKLFRAYQLTGESTSQLFSQLQQAGPTLRQLGLGFDESLALLAKWDKEGVESERIMAALRVGVANLTDSGLPVPETFRAITEQIHDMDDAAGATSLAIQVFGRRAGPELAEAIRAGRLSAEEYFDTIANGSDTVQKAADDTDDAAQRWARSSNRIALALEPVGSAAFDVANKVADHLTPAIETWAQESAPLVAGSAEKIIGFFDGIGQSTDALVQHIADLKHALDFGIQTPDVPAEKTLPAPKDIDLGAALNDRYKNLDLSGLRNGLEQEVADAVEEAVTAADTRATSTVDDFYAHLGLLFDQSLDASRLRASFGASGAAIASALETAWEKPLDQAARNAVASAEVALEEEIRNLFPAAQAAAMAEELKRRVQGAFRGGSGSEESAGLNSYLQGLNVQLPAQRKANQEAEAEQKRADAEAKRLQEQALREAERLAQAHADLLRQYSRTAEQLSPEIAAAYGEVGTRAFDALESAFEEGAGGGAGSGLARALSDMARAAKAAGLPDWEDTYRSLIEVGKQAIEGGTPELKAAALEMIRQVNESIKAANTLTPENLSQALGVAQLATAMGSQGAAISENLARGIEEGGRASIQALARSGEAMRVALFQNPNLSPAEARAWWEAIQAEINRTIDDGSEQAQQHLREYLAGLNRTLEESDIQKRALGTFDKALQARDDAIGQSIRNAREQVDRLKQGVTDSRTDRDAYKAETDSLNVYLEQAQQYVDSKKAERQEFRETEALKRQELKETADLERSYQEARAKLLEKKQTGDTASVGGNNRRNDGLVARAVNDPQAEANRALRELDAQHTKDLANLKETQAQRRADRDQQKKEQAEDRDYFKDLDGIITGTRSTIQGMVQEWQDRYQDTVVIGRQASDIWAKAAADQTKAQGDFTKAVAEIRTESNAALDRVNAVHEIALPEVKKGGDSALEKYRQDAEDALAAVQAAAAIVAGGGASGGSSGQAPQAPPPPAFSVTRDPLPPPPPPKDPLPPPDEPTSDPSTSSYYAPANVVSSSDSGGKGSGTTVIQVTNHINGPVGIPDLDDHILNTISSAQQRGVYGTGLR